jgi:exosortase family protein XrtF
VEILKKYSAVWIFLLKFFAVYVVGVLLYNNYLSDFTTHVDGVTSLITEQVAQMFSVTLPEITTCYSNENPIAEIKYFNVPIVLLIEGCNALSVMILFTAFVVAFKGELVHYLWFIPSGIVVLYIANLVRIYLIGMILLYYPNWVTMAHDFIFPGIIYGTTFILWVLWVKYFAINPKQA